MKKLLLILFTLPFFIACSSSDKEEDLPEPNYDTIIGNTYICKDRFASDHSKVKWIIYKINKDNSITIEERENTIDGNIYNNSIGFFEYEHSSLKLKIQSISGCDDCFNNFNATVSDSRRTISYEIYDISTGGKRTLKFHVYDSYFNLK